MTRDYERAALENATAVDDGDAEATLLPETQWPGCPAFSVGEYDIAVFFDCGEWDYIEAARPSGKGWESVDPRSVLFWFRPERKDRWPIPLEVEGFATQ